MKKHVPNFITCLNLMVGILGCISIVKGDLWNAIYFVLLAALFDFFDGLAARLLHVKSEIGKELDSLADMVSFGLLPALYLHGSILEAGVEPRMLGYVGLLIAPFSALRLARFNVDDSQTHQFVGLPTPGNAILITSLTFMPFTLEAWQLIVLGLISCFLLVSSIPLIALKFKNLDIQENLFKYLVILASVILVSIFGIEGVVYLIPTYLVLSIVGNFTNKKAV